MKMTPAGQVMLQMVLGVVMLLMLPLVLVTRHIRGLCEDAVGTTPRASQVTVASNASVA